MSKKSIFKKIDKNVSLSEKVEVQLKEAILQKVYLPGEQFPRELELVEIFCVSRTVIREALFMLAGQGLITINGRNGVYVSEIDFPNVVNPFSLLLKQKCGESSHLYLKQIRRLIEPEIARLAAEKRTDTDMAFLKKTFSEMQNRKNQPKKMIEMDIQFHRRLAYAAGNPIIPIIMEPIFLLLPEFISENYKLSHAPDISIEQHKEILTCLERQDTEATYEAMTAHMKTAEEHVLQYYKKIGFRDY